MDAQGKRELQMRSNLFDQVIIGLKTLIVRVGDGITQGIQPNEIVQLKAHNRSQDVCVRSIRSYHNFDEMLEREDASRIMPGANKHQALAMMRSMYSYDQERLGVYVLEVERIR